MTIRKLLINLPTFLLGFAATTVQADIYTVRVASQGGYVILGGSLIPLKEVTLSAQMPGRIDSIAGEEGGDFTAGTVLLTINDDNLQSEYLR